MLKADSKLHFILGQLIDQSCITNIAEDINEKLQREGFVSIIDLTRTYDLPGDFVNSVGCMLFSSILFISDYTRYTIVMYNFISNFH